VRPMDRWAKRRFYARCGHGWRRHCRRGHRGVSPRGFGAVGIGRRHSEPRPAPIAMEPAAAGPFRRTDLRGAARARQRNDVAGHGLRPREGCSKDRSLAGPCGKSARRKHAGGTLGRGGGSIEPALPRARGLIGRDKGAAFDKHVLAG
jgi:hypothetical protein